MDMSEEQEQRHDGENDNENDNNDGLRPRIEELKERIVSLNDRAKGYIRQHPAACLGAALGLGYLVARIARRRS